MIFTCYNQDTGEILFRLEGSISDAQANAPYVEGHFPAEEYIISNGIPVRKSDDEIEQAEKKEAWINLRIVRDNLLKDCDWTQASDAPVDHVAWAVYRQQLRDLPDNILDPRNVDWPAPPA